MGLSSKTDRKLIFAPCHYSGFTISDTWIQQGLQHLQLLLGHLCQLDQVGNLLRINIETLQILIGHPQPPLSYPYKEIRHIAPPSWLTTTWEFLNDIGGTITHIDPWNLPLDRQGYYYLMPKVLSQLVNTPKPLLSKLDLQKFNLCWIYLQVLTLWDIVTSSGKEIDCHFWKGHTSRKSSLTWPHQIRPSTACWAVWRKTLHLLFTDSVRSTKILPHHCLHSWYPKAPSYQLWPTFIDPFTSLIYTRFAQHNSIGIYSLRRASVTTPLPHTLPYFPKDM